VLLCNKYLAFEILCIPFPTILKNDKGFCLEFEVVVEYAKAKGDGHVQPFSAPYDWVDRTSEANASSAAL
jgi:hypothetical protein